MNIYKNLNEITKYIENHLEDKIDYEKLARIMGTSEYLLKRIFTMICSISLADYIRRRRLSNACYDLYYQEAKIIDIAIKYQYESATSFSRAFTKFHGFKPSEIKKYQKFKNYPRIVFNENIRVNKELIYEIISLNKLELYGKSIKTNNDLIKRDAPIFIQKIESEYGEIDYGMTTYDKKHYYCEKYYCLYRQKHNNFEKIIVPQSKWLKFTIDNQNPLDIQKLIKTFYLEFLPFCKFTLKDLPELEFYHDGITDFLVAIY